jgi:hypothetical protein
MLFAKKFNFSVFDLDPKRIYCQDENGLRKLQKNLLSILASSKATNKTATLFTSGTTSSIRNAYDYTLDAYRAIEDYHIQRIMSFNDLPFGNVFILKPVGTDRKIKPCEAQPFSDPYEWLPLGLKNSVRDLYYCIDYTVSDWNKTLAAASSFNPSFVYARPSEILLAKGAQKVQFPVLTSRETLHDYIRSVALETFSDCIDKMRCWDGGLSFFECKFKTKHINDELSLAESIDGKIFSTDFFNFDQKFVNYHNGDLGKIEQKTCDCGIYGNYFSYFGGKSMEVIVTQTGVVPGTLIADAIFQASEEIPAFIEKRFAFSILQNIDRSIIFKSDINLNDSHKSTIKKIFKNIDQNILVYFEPMDDVIKSKCMFIKSNAAKEFYSQ